MSLPKNWALEVDPLVYKLLRKLPRAQRERILEVIKLFPLDPYNP